MIIRKDHLEKIMPFIDKPIIKVLTGMRRSGKSTFLDIIRKELVRRDVCEKNILYMNFESSAFLDVTARELMEIVKTFVSDKTGKTYLFFDEIQQVEGWQRAINAFRVDYDCDIYITGSNASLLSGELATHIAGRYVSLEIQPFSFREYCSLYENSQQSKEELFLTYLRLGGMPFLRHFDQEDEPSLLYLNDLYQSIVLKDILARHQFRDADQLDRVIRFCISQIGNPISANSISRYFKAEKRIVSVDTILNYLSACQDAFLLRRIGRYDIQGKRLLQTSDKFYLSDHGFREAIIGNNLSNIQLILENIVCQELVRRGYVVTIGQNDTKEIDFMVEKNGKKIYYQVCYLLASEATIEREFGAFRGITDNFPKVVLSMDRIPMSRDGIQHMHMIDFLLSDEAQS